MKKFIHVCTFCSYSFEDDNRKGYVCPKCEEKIKTVKKAKMLDKAEYKLTHFAGKMRKKNNVDITKEIDIVSKRVSDGIDRFDSLQEAIVAVQLEKRNVKYYSQKMVGGKRVDFLLPDMKIILEIDGELYHTDEDKEFLRDRNVMREVGEEYEIVHLDSSCVPRYTWKLDITLPMIILERNENWRFRDSFADSAILEQVSVIIKSRERKNDFNKKNT